MLRVVPAGIVTVEHWSDTRAAANAGPSSPPELFNVHVPRAREMDGNRLPVCVNLSLPDETATTMYAVKIRSSNAQCINLISAMIDNVTSIQEQAGGGREAVWFVTSKLRVLFHVQCASRGEIIHQSAPSDYLTKKIITWQQRVKARFRGTVSVI